MEPLNNYVCLQPLDSGRKGLIITDQFAKFLVKAARDKSQVAPGDVVVCPVNGGIDYNGLKIVDERSLICKCAK